MTPAGSAEERGASVFFSYARADAVIVEVFAEALRDIGLHPLVDLDYLRPGESFQEAILAAIREADGLAVFVSPTSARSPQVQEETRLFVDASGRPLVPILIDGAGTDDLPLILRRYQAITVGDPAQIPDAARRVAEVFRARPRASREITDEIETRARTLARDFADERRGRVDDPSDVPANAVFLVHGHDHEFRDEVDAFLRSVGVRPVILAREAHSASRSLLQRFEALALEAKFAVVLLTPDDLGASRLQYEDQDVGEKALKYRARENVILELGFFYGRLGWDHVFIVQKTPSKVWPDFEKPSDLSGAEYLETTGEVDWHTSLVGRLHEAGVTNEA